MVCLGGHVGVEENVLVMVFSIVLLHRVDMYIQGIYEYLR